MRYETRTQSNGVSLLFSFLRSIGVQALRGVFSFLSIQTQYIFYHQTTMATRPHGQTATFTIISISFQCHHILTDGRHDLLTKNYDSHCPVWPEGRYAAAYTKKTIRPTPFPHTCPPLERGRLGWGVRRLSLQVD